MVRGLLYLVGSAENEAHDYAASLMIADTKLKKAAEEYRISISDRLIFCFLIMVLMNDEGISDDIMVEQDSIVEAQTQRLVHSVKPC